MPTKHTLLSLFNKDFQNPPVSRNKINFNKKGHTTVNKEHLHVHKMNVYQLQSACVTNGI